MFGSRECPIDLKKSTFVTNLCTFAVTLEWFDNHILHSGSKYINYQKHRMIILNFYINTIFLETWTNFCTSVYILQFDHCDVTVYIYTFTFSYLKVCTYLQMSTSVAGNHVKMVANVRMVSMDLHVHAQPDIPVTRARLVSII